LEKKELQQRVQKSINLLNEDECEIIILREFEEMNYREKSELLSIPEGTVMSRLSLIDY
jgi:DNA-directed RNA polymerase specialized sigma24 family protein